MLMCGNVQIGRVLHRTLLRMEYFAWGAAMLKRSSISEMVGLDQVTVVSYLICYGYWPAGRFAP